MPYIVVSCYKPNLSESYVYKDVASTLVPGVLFTWFPVGIQA